MGVQYFGQFLIENGYLTRDQLLDAIEHQKTVNVKLGVLAIDHGYMTASEVEKVLAVQRTVDKRFGEIAVDKGFISSEDLEKILTRQKTDRIYLGEALVQLNFLTYQQLQEFLEHYNQEQEKSEQLKDDSLGKLSSDHLKIVEEGAVILSNMLLRMLDVQGKVSSYKVYNGEHPEYDTYLVSQKLFGDQNLTLAISLNHESLCEMSSKILSMNIQELDELAVDGGKEFINIVIGHLSVALSNRGIKTETAPPVFENADKFVSEYSEPVIVKACVLMGEKNIHLYYFLSED